MNKLYQHNVRISRLRTSKNLRNLLSDISLSITDFVQPLFIKEGITKAQNIQDLPDILQYSLNDLNYLIPKIVNLQIPAILLFGIPQHKDFQATSSTANNNIMVQAIKIIKKIAPQLIVINDVCLCAYTDHGHCGLLNKKGNIDNKATLQKLQELAILYAKSGADIVAPSGMIDGMVYAIRTALDQAKFSEVAILSYAIKYNSAFYGPFREATDNTPMIGDRRAYQMNHRNSYVAFNEVATDITEGADMIIIKPALAYLDIIYKIKEKYPQIPISAYNVSGEYAILQATKNMKSFDTQNLILESLIAMKRAGANFIISYFSMQIASILN